jgi:hypothetical protein
VRESPTGDDREPVAEIPSAARDLPAKQKFGSSGRTRTYNPPVNSRMLCH